MDRTRLLASLAAVTVLATGCAAEPSATSAAGSAPLQVVASFYPLQFVVERVGGDRVDVSNLTPPGVEPHDLELTAADTVALHDSDLVVTLGGFSAAVDEAIDSVAADHVVDVAAAADLTLSSDSKEGGIDPHFWLDPTRLAAVAGAVADRLSTLDPERSSEFSANAAALQADLGRLDAQFAEGLANCASRDLVTSHNAFGYLAERYDLVQVGISGLTPEEEPSPGDLAAITDFVEANNVRTIYSETLVSSKVAATIAAETGAGTAVLDPLEGLTSDSAGADYLEVMRANLATLRAGQGCS